MMLLSVTEYAKKHNLAPVTVRQKIQRGTLPAIRIGNSWAIDEDEPYIDSRMTSGKYVNWRSKNRKTEE